MGKVIRAFCWHKKFVPKWLYALAPGLYTCIKWLKMYIKSDFEEIILKLAMYGQREKVFLLSSKGPIATLYCDVPTEKVIFKGEQTYVRIWSNGPSTSLVCICWLCFCTYMCFQGGNCGWIHVLSATCTLWFNFAPGLSYISIYWKDKYLSEYVVGQPVKNVLRSEKKNFFDEFSIYKPQ